MGREIFSVFRDRYPFANNACLNNIKQNNNNNNNNNNNLSGVRL
jgi:hypothetical protein